MGPLRPINQLHLPSFLQPSAFSKTGQWLANSQYFAEHENRTLIGRICRIFLRCVVLLSSVATGIWDVLIWSRVTVTPGGIARVGCKNHLYNLVSALLVPILSIPVLFGYYPTRSFLRGASYALGDHLFSAIYRKDVNYILKFREKIKRMNSGDQFSLLTLATDIPHNSEVLKELMAMIPEQEKQNTLSYLLLHTCDEGALNNIPSLIASQVYHSAFNWQIVMNPEIYFTFKFPGPHPFHRLNKTFTLFPFLLFSEIFRIYYGHEKYTLRRSVISHEDYRILSRKDDRQNEDRALAIIKHFISSHAEFHINEIEQAAALYKQWMEQADAGSFEAFVKNNDEQLKGNPFSAWAMEFYELSLQEYTNANFPGLRFLKNRDLCNHIQGILKRILDKREEIEKWQKEAAVERGNKLIPYLPQYMPKALPPVIASY